MPKFDSFDRGKIRGWYKQIGIDLSLVYKKKYFIDQYGKRYCLIGTREDLKQWHGIDKDILDGNEWIDGTLIIAICYMDRTDIYEGFLKPLFQNKGLLKSSIEYQFHSQLKGNFLTIKEIPNCYLQKKGSIIRTKKNSLSETDKELLKLLDGLSAVDGGET